MKHYVRSTLVMLPAVPIIACGVAFYLLTRLGADPFTSFQQGIAIRLGTSVGNISLAVNILILILFLFIDRKLIGIGSILFCFGIGPCINLFSGILGSFFVGPFDWPMLALFLVVGTVLIVLGLAYYIPIGVGIQPLDMVATKIGQLLHSTYGVGLTIFYILLTIGAYFLGGDIGIGTIIEVFLVGKLVDWCTPFMGKLSKALAGTK